MSNSRRAIRARREPDNPVSSCVRHVSRVDPAEVTNPFDPYGGLDAKARDRKFTATLRDAVRAGEWVVFRAVYRTYHPTIWVSDHNVKGHGTESAAHKRKKLVAAEFLDRCGHTLSRLENLAYDGLSKHTREWVYSPECFEVGYTPGVADVACGCENCSTYAEVGHVSAEKLLRAADSDADTVAVVPYGSTADHGRRGGEHDVYLFHRGDQFKH